MPSDPCRLFTRRSSRSSRDRYYLARSFSSPSIGRLRHAVEIQHSPEQPNAPCPRCRRSSDGDLFPGSRYGSCRPVEDESPDSGGNDFGSPTAPALHAGRPADDQATVVADHGDALVVGRRTMRKHFTEAACARPEPHAGAIASMSSADVTERALLSIAEAAAQTRCADGEQRALLPTPLEEDRLSCRGGQDTIALSLEPNQEVQLLRKALRRAQQEMDVLERSVMEGRSKVSPLKGRHPKLRTKTIYIYVYIV